MSSNQAPEPSGDYSPKKNKPLRRPHAATHERLINGIHDQNENQPITRGSTLSADAPEFVPKYAVAQQQQQQVEDALYGDFQRLMRIRPAFLNSGDGNVDNEAVVGMFKDAVFQLTTSPSSVAEYLKPIVDTLKGGVNDPEVINEIIEILLEQSISEANFRFTGARISKYLSNELKGHHVFGNFRSTLLNRCKKEFDKREELLVSNPERLCGLAMFFGELFLVLEVTLDDGTSQRIGILRGAIADLERTLLSRPDDVTVKCATQLLKLAGGAITESDSLAGNFTDIYSKIRTLEKHPSLNKTSHCLINSVLSRIDSNFGVDQAPSPQKPVSYPSNTMSANNFQLNEPIFYNSMGQPISREEAGFSQEESDYEGLNLEEQEAYLQWEAETLANQQWNEHGDDGYVQQPWSTGIDEYTQWSTNQEDQGFGFPEQDYNNYDDFSYSGMDDEMVAAYEMFLRESQQRRH